MSGRDLKQFLHGHKSAALDASLHDGSDLTNRFIGGQKRSTKYRDVAYEQLKELADKYKQSGLNSLKHISKLSQKTKQSKENSLLKQHSEIWTKASSSLNCAREMAQVELESVRAQLASTGDEETSGFFRDALTHEAQTIIEREEFHSSTVKPVLQLMDDLKYWIRQQNLHRRGRERDQMMMLESHCAVRDELARVKSQQEQLVSKLEETYTEINKEIELVEESYFGDDHLEVEQGVPVCVEILTCPYEDLKESVLKEFELTDIRYISLLDKLKGNYFETLKNPRGDWSSDEWLRMVNVLSQYPAGQSNRRALYIDRLLRELPHKTRAEIVTHEELFTSMQYYKERRQALLKSWKHDRQELAVKVEATFASAWEQYEADERLHTQRAHQQNICQQLYDKVVAWREAKEEIIALEAVMGVQVREQRLAKEREEKIVKKQFRQQQKKMIEVYQHQQSMELENTLKEEQKRLEQLKENLLAQAEEDKTRVQYRVDRQMDKLQEKRAAQEKRRQDDLEREKRLEQLRAKVQVNVESDPCRVLRETQAYQAKVAAAGPQDSAELELQAPLFKHYSFPTEKIEADQRFKLTNALLKAGLSNTNYARTILASIPPQKPPRPDQTSSIFK